MRIRFFIRLAVVNQHSRKSSALRVEATPPTVLHSEWQWSLSADWHGRAATSAFAFQQSPARCL